MWRPMAIPTASRTPSHGRGPSIRRARTGTCRPVAIDYYNNYMTNFHDNAVEIDGSMHNVRVMRNMMLNSASHPFCNQPDHRRTDLLDPQHHLQRARRLDPADQQRRAGRDLSQQHHPDRDQHPAPRPTCHWMNNLMLGQNSQPAILAVNTYTNYSSSDYNGFRAQSRRGLSL